MKNRLVGTELFRADGRTDMTKPIVAFWNISEGPEKTIIARSLGESRELY